MPGSSSQEFREIRAPPSRPLIDPIHNKRAVVCAAVARRAHIATIVGPIVVETVHCAQQAAHARRQGDTGTTTGVRNAARSQGPGSTCWQERADSRSDGAIPRVLGRERRLPEHTALLDGLVVHVSAHHQRLLHLQRPVAVAPHSH
eukprot:6375934-Prymnesium_polylepis.1